MKRVLALFFLPLAAPAHAEFPSITVTFEAFDDECVTILDEDLRRKADSR